jgi:hypothetical protein
MWGEVIGICGYGSDEAEIMPWYVFVRQRTCNPPAKQHSGEIDNLVLREDGDYNEQRLVHRPK